MKRQILAVSILLVATQLFGQESRFWVGGSGKWADNSHWATVSGGEPGATVPESGTSVVFDANSFSGAKNTVTLSDEVVIGSLTATDAEFVFSGKKDLTVGGSVSVDSNVDFGKLRGALVLSADGNQTLNLPATLDGDIIFNGGNWTLASDLATEGNITLNAGSLNTSGHSVTCSVFTATENAEELDIRNSSMVTDKWFTNAAENMNVKAAGSTVFVYKHTSTNFRKANGQLYSRVRIKSTAKDDATLKVTWKKDITCPENAANDDDGEIYVAIYEVEVIGGSGTYTIGALKDNSSVPSVYNKTGKKGTIKLAPGTYNVGFYAGSKREDYALDAYETKVVVAPPKFEGGIEVATNADCYGGDVVLKSGVKGGTGALTVLWNEDEPTETNAQNITAADGTTIYLKVTDAKDCYIEPSPFFYYTQFPAFNSYITGPDKIEIKEIEKEPACEEESNGAIKVLAKGGYLEHTYYKYTLTGPENKIETEATTAKVELTGLKKGDYTLKISDDKCESDNLTVELSDVKKPTIDLGADEYLCEGEKTYTIKNAKVTGTYTSVEWNSDEASAKFSDEDQKTVLKPKLNIIGTDATAMTMIAKNGACVTAPALKTVTVISAPSPTITTTDNVNVCGLEIDIEAAPGVSGNDANLTAEVDEVNSDGSKASGSSGLKLKVTKAGQYKIFVKEKKTENNCNCSGTSDTITVNFFSEPKFKATKFSSAKNSACGKDEEISITANVDNATTYAWSLEKGANSSFSPKNEATTKYKTLEADVTTHKEVILRVIAGNDGCTGDDAVTDTYKINVYAMPEPKIKAKKYTTCTGTIDLEGTITNGNTREEWVESDASKGDRIEQKLDGAMARAEEVVKEGVNSGTFKVTLKEKNAGNCEGIADSATIEFKGKPNIRMVNNDTAFCDGSVTSYTARYTDKQYATTIQWNAKGLPKPTMSEGGVVATYTFKKEDLTTLKRYVIKVEAEEPGCGSAVDSVVVKVLPVPKITINRDTTVCGTVYKVPTYVPSVTIDDDEYTPTYAWSSGDESIAEYDNGIFKVVNMGDKDSVTCTVFLTEIVGNCQSSKDANVKFYAKPVANIGNGYPDSVCYDANDMYIDLSSAAPKHCKSVKWFSSGVEFIPTVDNKYKVTDKDKKQKFIKLTLWVEGFGCCDAAEDSVKIIIKSLPTPTILNDDEDFEVCQNDVVTYETQSGMTDYVWKVDGEEKGNSKTFTHKWIEDPTLPHTISVSYSNGCAASEPVEKPVTIHTLPEINHPLQPKKDTICTGVELPLDATANDDNNNFSYVWKYGDVDYLVTAASQPDVKFYSEDAGDYQLICSIKNNDYGCSINDTVKIHVVPAPVIKVNTITPVCEKADFINNYEPGKYYVEVENNDDCTYLWEVVSGTGDFDGTEEDLEMVYKPTPADREAGEVKIKFSVTKKYCSTVSDTITVKLLKPLNAGVGSVAPFRIASTTEINVTIKGSYKGGYANGLGFYLVAPDGTEVDLYDHNADYNKLMCSWIAKPGVIDVTFTTTSNKSLFFGDLAMEDTLGGEKKYDILGDWSNIYGKNPAEGGWSVKIGGPYTGGGKFVQAVITFADHEKNDPARPIKKVKFDSKEMEPALSIRSGSRIKYVSPIGLHVDCHGDSIYVVSKPLRDGDSDEHLYNFVWATDSKFTAESIIAQNTGKTADTLKLPAQKYFIKVIDELGCSATDSFEITQPEKIMVGLVRNDSVRCYGETNGSLKVGVSNVGADLSKFTFSWKELGGNKELSDSTALVNLAAGSYVVRVKNNEDECYVDSVLTVVQPNAPLTVEIIADSVKPASCGGDPNGQVMFIANGGTRNYSLFADGILKDSDKADTLAATGLAGKKVEFKIKDARGCELDTAVSVAPDTLSLEYAITEEIKCLDDSATVKVTVKNAKPSDAFTFKWDGGEETSASTMKLVAGVHKVEVAPFGTTCFTELPITVKGARSITKKIIYTDSIKCYGDETASFYVKADSVGTPSGHFTYTWKDDDNNIWNDTAVTNVGVGKYYLTILTDDGCEIYDTVEVKGPDSKLEIDHSKVKQTALADCGEENGSVTALGAVTGGLKPANGYDFQWILQSDETQKKGGHTITAGIGAGFYKIVVTDSLGCKATDTLTVKDNGQVDFNYEIVKSVTCKEREDAQIRISQVMENGAAASSFKLEWINKSGYSQIGYSQNDTTITNVGNNATLTITTAHGCSTEALIEALGDSTLRFIEPITNYPDMNGTPERANGSLTVEVAGGIGAYAYDWSVEVPGNEITAVNIENTDSTTTLKKRMAGKYHLSVTDESSCSIDTTLEVKYEPIDAIVTIDSVKCKGTDGGKVKLTGFGGYDGVDYVFHWVKTTDVNSVPVESEPIIKEGDEATFTNLTAGWYECLIWQLDSSLVRVRDTSIWVGEPTIALRVPNDSITIDSTYCYATSGAITVKAPADSAAAYDIYNGYYPLTISVKNSQNDVIAPTGLAAGWYTIHVEDALGCEYDKAVEVGDKSKFEVKANDVDLRCFGSTNGKVEVEASIENASAFTYSWMKWIDSKGDTLPLPGTVISEDSVVKGLAAGAYIVNVTVNVDNHTCVKSDTAYVNQPDSISFKLSNVKDNTCFTKADGIVRLDSLNGGFKVPNRKYEMFIFMSDDNNIYDDNNELTNRYIAIADPSVAVDSSFTFEGHLLTGEHKVVVVDEGGCLSDTIAFTVNSLPRVSFAVSNIEPNSCYNSNDGEVKLENLQGGVEKYNFFEVLDVNKNVLFSDSMMVVSKSDSIGTDTTAIFAPGLTVGKYLVRVADTSDCFSEYDTLQVFTKRPRIVLDTIIENVLPECGMFKKDGSVSNEGVVTAFASKLMTPDVKTMGADLKLFFKVDDGEFKADSVLTKLTAGKHNITISYADTLCADTVYAFNLDSKSNLVADAHFIGTPKAIFSCPDKELTAYVESGENGGPFSYKFYTLSDEEAEKLLPVEPAPEPAKEEKPVENNTAVDDSTTNTADTVAYRYNRGIYFRADSVPAVDTTGNPAVTDTVPVLLPVYDHQTIRGRMVSVLASGSREDGSVKVSGDTWRAYADDIKPYGYETFYYFEITNDQCISVDSIKATALRPVEDLQIIVDMEDVTFDELLIDGEYQVPEGGLLTLTANQLEFEFSDNIFAYAENGWLWQSAPADNNESSTSGLFIGRIETTSPSMNENPLVAQGYGRFIAKVWDSVRFELSDYSEGVYRISDTTLTCSYYDTVVVNAESTIKPRKVFTPNGDGHNDTWKIAGMASYDKATIYVFNRWGGRVWQYSGTGREYDTKEWDGRNEKNKPVPSGTYYYVIQCSDGVLGGKKVTGPVTIIR